ncbi:MAG: 4'-phosphopantetheinyl transferase family protein [Eubacteriaceae bacterium]
MKLYLLNINVFHSVFPKKYLLAERESRIDQYMKLEDKKRCLAVGLLMRAFLNVTKEDQLSKGVYGKPFLRDHSIYFNFSHSGDFVILATSFCEVGVDIEKIESYNINLIKGCLTDTEQKWLFHNPNRENFYKLWTAKESIMKATGKGLTIPPESFCVLPLENGEHIINKERFFLQFFSLKDHELCVATTMPDKALNLTLVTLPELLKKL